MRRSTPAPTVRNAKYLPVIYGIAALFVIMSAVQLLRFEQFMAILGSYGNGTTDAGSFAIGIGLAAAEVGALAFLLRLDLSPLARWLSALCLLLAPFAWAVVMIQALLRGLNVPNVGYLSDIGSIGLSWLLLAVQVLLVAAAWLSFWALRGSEVILGMRTPK